MARIRHVGEPIIHTRDLSVHTVAPIGRLFFVKPMEVLARERSQNFLNSFEYTIFPQHPEVGTYSRKQELDQESDQENKKKRN